MVVRLHYIVRVELWGVYLVGDRDWRGMALHACVEMIAYVAYVRLAGLIRQLQLWSQALGIGPTPTVRVVRRGFGEMQIVGETLGCILE